MYTRFVVRYSLLPTASLAVRAQYKAGTSRKKTASRALYLVKQDSMIAAARVASRICYANNYMAKLKSFRKYYVNHKKDICLAQRGRYILLPPKPDVRQMFLKEVQGKLLSDCGARSELMTAFK